MLISWMKLDSIQIKLEASAAGEYLILIGFQFIEIAVILLVEILFSSYCSAWWLLLNAS